MKRLFGVHQVLLPRGMLENHTCAMWLHMEIRKYIKYYGPSTSGLCLSCWQWVIMNIRFYAENGIYILQVRSLHHVFRSLVFMNDITPTHSVRCESTTEFPKKIISMGRESLTEQRNSFIVYVLKITWLNPLKPELSPICYLLALLGAHHFLHVSRIRVKLLTLRLLMS